VIANRISEPPAALSGAQRAKVSLEWFREFGILIAFVLLFVVLSLSSDVFLTKDNLLNILNTWAPTALMALGGTFVLLAGGFDLSIGGILSVASVITAQVANSASPVVAVLAGIGMGVALGLANGLLVTVGRMNPFVVTIGASIVFGGLAAIISRGFVIQVDTGSFTQFTQDSFLGAKLSVWVFLVAAIGCALLLNVSSFGRFTRAVGSNPEAARLSGVRVGWVRAGTYAISGLGGGVAAVIITSSGISANPAVGTSGIQFNVWAALLLGGNSMFGGIGAIWRTVVGVMMLAIIQNGFDLLGVDPLWQQTATGLILLGAVAIDAWARRNPA
jgi:ribose transport system permease protein